MKKYLLITLIISTNYFAGFTQSFTQPGKGTCIQVGPIILRGTIILPDDVIRDGYVTIVSGRIASISKKRPMLPNAVIENTNGVILPGLLDVHNHVPFNVLPRWKPGRLFTNRNQWRTDPEVIGKINGPIDRLEPSSFCDMNAWGELRALIGGTTSIMVTHAQPCVKGLVRNLDLNSGFYGTTELDREHIFNVLDVPPASNPAARAEFVGAAVFFIANPFYEALFIHLAEGIDAAAKEEFSFMQSQSLINPKGAVIHGIPLTRPDFDAMATKGTALIWSPRSNIELYGKTANINAALDAGVEIALAPDWAVTGSSNLLNELKVAAQWNRKRLGGRLTDQQLVNMVTTVPAHIAGIDDEVGAIKVGLRADILVIKGNHNKPYRAVIDATAADVELVFIDGVPIYGDRMYMKHFWDNSQLQQIKLPEATKTLATPAANIIVADIEKRLQRALKAEGISLAPLSEVDNFALTAPEVFRQNGSPNIEKEPIQITKTQKLNNGNGITGTDKFAVTVLYNPSSNYFTLKIKTNSSKRLQLMVTDALGRTVESGSEIKPNATFYIGNNFRSGIYLVEIRQGTNRQVLKLIKQ